MRGRRSASKIRAYPASVMTRLSCERPVDARECVRRIVGAVAGLVVGVFESMPGIGIDLDVHRPAQRFHSCLEGVNRVGRYALVLAAKVAHEWQALIFAS